MRINRSLLNWGVFLIALGGIPLAVDQGWIESDVAGDLGRLWPLILVGIGLGLILRWTPMAWFGGALVAATFGIIFGAALVAVPDDDIGNLQGIIPAIASGVCVDSDAGPASSLEGGVANGSAFELDLTLSCGELIVTRAADARWAVKATHDEGDAPVIDESDLDGATAYLRVDQRDGGDLGFFGGRVPSAWRLELPAASSLTVAATLNATRASIDLGAGPVERVSGTYNASDVLLDLRSASTPERATMDLTMNASDGRLLLPDGDIGANITLNASSLSVCIPASTALRVEPSSVFSSDDLGASGLVEANPSLWTTPGFSTAGDHVDLAITSTVSDLSIERPEACS